MVVVDCCLAERKSGKVFKWKVSTRQEYPLSTVIKKSIHVFLEKDDPMILEACVDRVMKHIESIPCNDSDVTEYVE